MKIDVEKLIDQIRRHPEIYNPDHKDFSNEEIRANIFNTLISKEMNGIKGEILHRKWDKVLNKYASFIRKLSNDDSSQTVLERFMEWPWTKHMRIFKPYVRKQFQIPEFQSAIQIPEMDPNDLRDFPFLIPRSVSLSVSAMPRPEYPRAMPMPRSVFPHPLSMPRPEFACPLPTPRRGFAHPLLSLPRPEYPSFMPTAIRPEFAHAASRVDFHGNRPAIDFSSSNGSPQPAHGTSSTQLSSFMEHVYMASTSSSMTADGNGNGIADDFRDIAAMIGLAPSDDEDDDDVDSAPDSDGSVDTDEATDGGPSPAKKMRLEEKTDDAEREHGENDDGTEGENDDGTDGDNVADNDRRENRTDCLPDLPLPKPLAERSPSDFTAQEHIFLAWAKTMSTFTAKRQATIKMQINKIMSEAEFEDLDDEFFAAKRPSPRPIYTSRL